MTSERSLRQSESGCSVRGVEVISWNAEKTRARREGGEGGREREVSSRSLDDQERSNSLKGPTKEIWMIQAWLPVDGGEAISRSLRWAKGNEGRKVELAVSFVLLLLPLFAVSTEFRVNSREE